MYILSEIINIKIYSAKDHRFLGVGVHYWAIFFLL